jgi:hypothetical protein
MTETYDVCLSDGLKWQDINTNFHDNWFRFSSNTESISATISVDSVLVLLMRGIYDVCHWDSLRCHDMHVKFQYGRFRHSSNIIGMTETI